MGMMNRKELVAVAIVFLSVSAYVLHRVSAAKEKVFTEQLIQRIAKEVGPPPGYAVPADLFDRLMAVGVFEWNAHLRKGEPIADMWGTPIQFIPHPPSGLDMQSAGKDQIFGTRDDYSVRLDANQSGTTNEP